MSPHRDNSTVLEVPGLSLNAYPQWLCWSFKTRGLVQKPAKVPIDPKTGNHAAVNRPETWGTLEQALGWCREHGGGIGFVLTENDPFVAIDLDNCRDAENGAIAPWAAEIVKDLNSYSEVSPSGTGLHVLVNATLGGPGRRKAIDNAGAAIEIYDRQRYITVTGVEVAPHRVIADRQEEVAAIYERFFGAPSKPPKPKPPFIISKPVFLKSETPDEEVLVKASEARNGEKFKALYYGGDLSSYSGDHSRADLALCRLLAFWTDRNASQMDRLFRASALFRDKWETQRGELTYGEVNIQRAIQEVQQ